MTVYFTGGEDHDFVPTGATSVNTATTAARDTTNARCALVVGGATTGAADGWAAAFSAAAAVFWMQARLYIDTNSTSDQELVSFTDGATKRLAVRWASGGRTVKLSKRNAAGTWTDLATSVDVIPITTLARLSVDVNYAVAGSVKVYFGGTQLISYTGDVTTDSATSLSSFRIGSLGSGSSSRAHWSEAVVCTDDPRSFDLRTLPLAANGNAWNFTGSYADVDEVTTNDADLATSSAANDLAQATVTSSAINAAHAVKAVCVSARAMKGGTGPTQAQMNVRTSATDYFSSSIALAASLGRVANIWETNPNTAAAWVPGDITAAGFNVGMKSIA